MELRTYKIMLNISSWLHVTKKYRNVPWSNTWKGYPKHNLTHTEPAWTLWACLRIRWNQSLPTSLDAVLAQVNCLDDQTGVNVGERFQVPDRTETVRGGRSKQVYIAQVCNLVFQVQCLRIEAKHGTQLLLWMMIPLRLMVSACSWPKLKTEIVFQRYKLASVLIWLKYKRQYQSNSTMF